MGFEENLCPSPLESKMAAVSSVEVLTVYPLAWRDWKSYPKFWGGSRETTLHKTSVLLAVETCMLANDAIIYDLHVLHDAYVI